MAKRHPDPADAKLKQSIMRAFKQHNAPRVVELLDGQPDDLKKDVMKAMKQHDLKRAKSLLSR